MRGTWKSVFAAAAVVVALWAQAQTAGAMTLSAPHALAAVHDEAIVRVKTVCEKEWDGYQWQERCRNTRAKSPRSAQIRRLQRRIFYYLRHW